MIKELPSVTMICVDCKNYGPAMMAIRKSLEQIKPARTIFFTDIELTDQDFEVVRIKRLTSAREYSYWMMKELGTYGFTTQHLLIIQHDGYVLHGDLWNDEWLGYDYIGAPWLEADGFNVGNGGFSLRSANLHYIMAQDDIIIGHHPEDAGICRVFRDYLERKYGLLFAPDNVAHHFSYELHTPRHLTFGFHGPFHPEYKPYVVIKREGAMGDVVQLEPVMRYYNDHGYNVVLDSPFASLFHGHFYNVIDWKQFDKIIPHQIINLDLAYEHKPRQLHLQSYFEACGITDYKLSNPQLNYQVNDRNRIFKRYCVIHIDERETSHRNVYGVDWPRVVRELESLGLTVIQIGHGPSETVALRFNTVNYPLLQWLIAGAEFFIGIDSGPSNIAVALGRPCVLFFGSVNPEFIHADLSRVTVVQKPCPIQNDGCWHSVPGTTGVECVVPERQEEPPCCTYSTTKVLAAINQTMLLIKRFGDDI